MAQAARLSLRMQKELKLLLTDPPHGATFPLLSPDSDLSLPSLSSIDAQIEGPEGTVYAEGIFKIKIQIPERYPFQPPLVTFATPIYHPNIDNGGRICLDILNLPPKGAWQPSLNISTVITSIGLLLGEPNPDDGLMCDASKEYKYNRHAFDQKARSMTQKYARAGGSGRDCGGQDNQEVLSNPSMMAVKEPDVSKCEVNDEYFSSHKKLYGIGRKLSLERPGSNQKWDSGDGLDEVPMHNLLGNQMKTEESKGQSKQSCNEYHRNHEKLQVTKRKLSLGSLGSSQRPVFHDKDISAHQDLNSSSMNDNINTSSKQLIESSGMGQIDDDSGKDSLPQLLPAQSHNVVPNKALPMPEDVKNNEKRSLKDPVDRTGWGFKNTGHKKLGLAGKRLSLGFSGKLKSEAKHENNENVPPIPSNHSNVRLNLYSDHLYTTPLKSRAVPEDSRVDEKQQIKTDNGEKFSGETEQKPEGSPISETVIVSDSEESEEENNEMLRPKPLLARKRLLGKWKAKA